MEIHQKLTYRRPNQYLYWRQFKVLLKKIVIYMIMIDLIQLYVELEDHDICFYKKVCISINMDENISEHHMRPIQRKSRRFCYKDTIKSIIFEHHMKPFREDHRKLYSQKPMTSKDLPIEDQGKISCLSSQEIFIGQNFNVLLIESY